MRPALSAVLESLLANRPTEVSLDAIAEALGTTAVTPDEVGTLIDQIEATGAEVVGAPPSDLREDLTRVLTSARALQVELGRKPSQDEIAAHAGLDAAALRRALLFGRVLSR